MSSDDTTDEIFRQALSARDTETPVFDYDRLGVAIVDELERRGYFGQLNVDAAVEFNRKVMARMLRVEPEQVADALRGSAGPVQADQPGEAVPPT